MGDHTEVFQVDYDPQQLSYSQLLDLFWASHNPAAQSYSRQYMAAVFYHNDSQRKLAEDSKAELAANSGQQVNTDILPLDKFYRAEEYHQKYYLRHNSLLFKELQSIYPSEVGFAESTLAARLNSYMARHGYRSVLESELESYGLGTEATGLLQDLATQLDEGAFGGAACDIAI